MQQPPFLKPGDRIGLFAPARKVSRGEAEPAARIIESWGFEPVFGKNLFAADNQLAGTDRQRAEDLHHFLVDPSIKAVLAMRGGYGCVRMMPFLQPIYEKAKWIIGYSDISVLHAWANQKLGWQSIHGTMPINMIQEGEERIISSNSLLKALKGEPETLSMPEHPLQKGGNAEGILTGGNLSVLYSMLGSDLQCESNGKLLLLEDLDEYLYHIDRMMQAMNRSGITKNCAALLIGGMNDMRDNAIPFGKTAEEIISVACSQSFFPLRFGMESGHIPLNRSMIFGANYRLDGQRLIPLL